MNVVLYARVSTVDQNVKQQVSYLEDWFSKQGHKIKDIVKDEESGRLPLTQRKKFNKLLVDIDKQGFKGAVGILNLDRLTRCWDDVTYIERFFRDRWNKCQLISTQEPIDLGSATGRMMFRLKVAVSCYMPEDMMEKQRIGIERARKEGKYKGGAKGRSWKKTRMKKHTLSL